MADRAPGVVIVGTGFGCRVHAPAARHAGFDVVALVGTDAARTERRAGRAQIERSFTSLSAALALPNADVVVIATPPDSHASLAEEAIAAGRHVLVEKPFTLDSDEAARLVEAAERAGVTALVGHEFRFVRERVTLLHAIADGLIGQPMLTTLLGHADFLARFAHVMPAWWYQRGRGGWLGAAVSHRIDAVRVWLGDIATVSAGLLASDPNASEDRAEDTVSMRFTLRSGCEGVLQDSAAVWGGALSITTVAGTAGTAAITPAGVTLADADGVRTLAPAGPDYPVTVPPSDAPGRELLHIELEPAVVQAMVLADLVAGRAPRYDAVAPATFADGLACMQVLDAVRRSAREGGAAVTVEAAPQ